MIQLQLTNAEAEAVKAAFPGEIADRINAQLDKQPKGIKLADQIQLFKRIAAKHMINSSEIIGPSRKREIVVMRDEVIWELRLRGLSTSAIGRIVNRDHTTVLAALRREEERRNEQ